MTTLQDRIQARLEAALLTQERTGVYALEARAGLATGGPDAPAIRLTVEDVARLAAVACTEWIEDTGGAARG